MAWPGWRPRWRTFAAPDRRSWIAAGLGAVLVGALVAALLQSADAWRPLARLSLASLTALAVVSLAALGVQGLQFGVLARIFGMRLTGREALGLTCINNMMSYSLPVRGGTLVRAAYLQQVHGFALGSYAALTVSSHVVILGLVALAGGALAWTVPAHLDVARSLALGFVAAPVVLVGALLGLAGLADLGRRVPGLAGHAQAFRHGLASWRRHPGLAARFALVSLVVFAVHGLRLWVAFRALGVAASLPEVLLVQAAVAVASVVSFTPANLGTKEAVITLVAVLIGLDPSPALVAGLLDRAIAVAESLLGGAMFSRGLLRDVRRAPGG
jgi:uncharacterized membrane protein YbhN (UPF0104 family)